MLVATEVFRRKMRSAYRETRAQVSRMNAFLQEHVTGMSVVQIFGREPEEQRRFEGINRDHRDAQIQTVYYFAAFFPVVDLIAACALAAVLWFGGTEAMRDALTIGTLVAFIQYVRMFFEPVRNLSDQLNAVQAAFAASERVFDLLDDDQSLPVSVGAAAPRGRPRPGPHRVRERVVHLRVRKEHEAEGMREKCRPKGEAVPGDGHAPCLACSHAPC